VRVRGFFSFFFIVSMDILSEVNFMMMMMISLKIYFMECGVLVGSDRKQR